MNPTIEPQAPTRPAGRPPAGRETPDIDTSSAAYATRFDGPIGQWFLQRQAEAVRALIKPWAGGRVLEVGGGHGQLLPVLLDLGCEVTVLASDATCEARLAPWRGHPRFKFASGNLLGLPYSDRSFDAVVSVRLLAHLTRWERAIEQMARVARHAVLVDYAAQRSLNALTPWLFGMKQRVETNTRHYRSFRHAEIQAAFRRAGFAPSGRTPQFFWPMAMHRLLKRPAVSKPLEAAARAAGLTAQFGSPVIARYARQAAP